MLMSGSSKSSSDGIFVYRTLLARGELRDPIELLQRRQSAPSREGEGEAGRSAGAAAGKAAPAGDKGKVRASGEADRARLRNDWLLSGRIQ
jgi:hypothetical protein